MVVLSIAVWATVTALVAWVRGALPNRALLWVAVFSALPYLLLPLAQPAAKRIFHDDFVSFAGEIRAGDVPRTESFRIGPYTYNRVCHHPSSGKVTIWHSNDGFIVTSAIVIRADDSIGDIELKEQSEGTFSCARARILDE